VRVAAVAVAAPACQLPAGRRPRSESGSQSSAAPWLWRWAPRLQHRRAASSRGSHFKNRVKASRTVTDPDSSDLTKLDLLNGKANINHS